MKLFGREFHHRLLSAWPDKTVSLKPFHHQPETRALIEQQLDAIGPLVTEGEDRTGEWTSTQLARLASTELPGLPGRRGNRRTAARGRLAPGNVPMRL